MTTSHHPPPGPTRPGPPSVPARDQPDRTDDGPRTGPGLHAEVYRLVHPVVTAVRAHHGRVPAVGSAAWWGAPDDARVAGLLVLTEHHLVSDPNRLARERLKATALDLSAAHDWRGAARRPSHAELTRRRGAA